MGKGPSLLTLSGFGCIHEGNPLRTKKDFKEYYKFREQVASKQVAERNEYIYATRLNEILADGHPNFGMGANSAVQIDRRTGEVTIPWKKLRKPKTKTKRRKE